LKTPIKTLDLPIAGRAYSAQALPLLFDLVNIANDVPVDKKRKGHKVQQATLAVADALADQDGAKTIEYLKQTRKLVERVSSTHPSSLGLHPAVYFYSATGRHQHTSFLAAIRLMKEFEKTDGSYVKF